MTRKKCALIRNSCGVRVHGIAHIGAMKTPVILLLTNDPQLEDAVAQGLASLGGFGHLACSAGDALQIVCGVGREVDLAIIDFEHGPHGMTLLGAINACRKDFPVIVVTHEEEQHVAALAFANGAIECLAKPVAVTQISAAIKQYCPSQHQLACVA